MQAFFDHAQAHCEPQPRALAQEQPELTHTLRLPKAIAVAKKDA